MKLPSRKANSEGSTESSPPLRVLLADDHRMILDIFSAYLSSAGRMLVRVSENFLDASKTLEEEGPFDIVLLDLNMPGMYGVESIKAALNLNSNQPVAVITGSISSIKIKELLDAGASGVILKSTSARSLASAIRFMASGEKYIPVELHNSVQSAGQADPSVRLSQREVHVLHLLSHGKTNREIAVEISTTEQTVKAAVHSIFKKLGVSNRTKAVITAKSLGLV